VVRDRRDSFGWFIAALTASERQRLLRLVEPGIIDRPLRAFPCLLDGVLLRCKHNRAVSGSPRQALILAIDPVKWPPNFIRRIVYLAGCGMYRESFVIVIHIPSLARYGTTRWL